MPDSELNMTIDKYITEALPKLHVLFRILKLLCFIVAQPHHNLRFPQICAISRSNDIAFRQMVPYPACPRH